MNFITKKTPKMVKHQKVKEYFMNTEESQKYIDEVIKNRLSNMKCKSCGNENPEMLSMGGGLGETCENCDPLMHVPTRPDFICPNNDIYCMWESREGHRSMCGCFGCDIKDWRGDTAFRVPNYTLIESLINSCEKRDQNRIVNILTSEKLVIKYFHSRECIPYEVRIVKKQ